MAQKKLQGRVAVVTGAGRGIGRAAALALGAAGATVVAMARTEPEIAAVVTELQQSGRQALSVAGDISDLIQVEEVVESALDQFGRIDILVNSAGLVWPIDEIADADPEEWAYALHVNLVGPFYMIRSVLPLMLEQKYGRVVMLGADPAQKRLPGGSAYHTAKAGLDTFSQILAQEVAGTRVLVNVLYPGVVDTELQADIRSIDTDDSNLDLNWWHDQYEAGTLVQPSVIAQMIVWLCGPWVQTNGTFYRADDQEWKRRWQTDLR